MEVSDGITSVLCRVYFDLALCCAVITVCLACIRSFTLTVVWDELGVTQQGRGWTPSRATRIFCVSNIFSTENLYVFQSVVAS